MAVHPDARSVVDVNRDLRDNRLRDLDLPIARACCGDAWIYAASAIELDDGARPYMCTYKKAKHCDDAFYLEKSVMTIGGLHKDWIKHGFGYVTPAVSFLAASDEPDVLHSFCMRVTSIGKLRGMGYGQIAGLDVRKIDGSWTRALVHEGRAMRNLPARFVTGEASEEIIARPPYWGMYRREPGVSPGKPAILNEGVKLASL